MGLSIGVVNIRYLERPEQPIYRFMQDLMEDPETGLANNAGEDDWFWDGGGSGENAFYQFTRQGLVNRAGGWANRQNLDAAQRQSLLNWIEALPYQGDAITLHLGF